MVMEGMEEVKGLAHHNLLVKFRDGTSPEKIEEIIRAFCNLKNLIPCMLSFDWGLDSRVLDMHEGFTHIFHMTFDSLEGIKEYLDHPAHEDFAEMFVPHCEKRISIDYKPIVSLR